MKHAVCAGLLEETPTVLAQSQTHHVKYAVVRHRKVRFGVSGSTSTGRLLCCCLQSHCVDGEGENGATLLSSTARGSHTLCFSATSHRIARAVSTHCATAVLCCFFGEWLGFKTSNVKDPAPSIPDPLFWSRASPCYV